MGKMVELSYQRREFEAYLAEPEGEVRGGIIVIHEVWGLNDHTKDIANRFAAEGYLALAPSLLAETDISKHAAELQLDLFNPAKRNEAQPKLRALMTPLQDPSFGAKTVGRLRASFDYLYDLPATRKKVAVNGYCFGGSYTYNLAMVEPRLKAAIPFYGHIDLADPNKLRQISCPVLAFYGEQDESLISGLPNVEAAMQTAGANYTARVYPGCGHAFFNDTNPFAYNKAAAADAWQRSLTFLSRHLK
ncbi:MAG: dienelactone hydrolase family protein [Candidatus Saccharimonadales bacterium]